VPVWRSVPQRASGGAYRSAAASHDPPGEKLRCRRKGRARGAARAAAAPGATEPRYALKQTRLKKGNEGVVRSQRNQPLQPQRPYPASHVAQGGTRVLYRLRRQKMLKRCRYASPARQHRAHTLYHDAYGVSRPSRPKPCVVVDREEKAYHGEEQHTIRRRQEERLQRRESCRQKTVQQGAEIEGEVNREFRRRWRMKASAREGIRERQRTRSSET